MNVLVKSSNGITQVSADAKLHAARWVFVCESIDSETADSFLKQMLLLLDEDDKKPIRVIINSPGGEVNAGLMMYDTIQLCKKKVKVITCCCGTAASMGAVLLSAGTKGERYLLRHSRVMVHEPLIKNGFGGSATSVRKTAEEILKIRDTLNDLLAENTGRTREEMDEATSYDNYMNAEEAVEFGLCDRIVC